LKHDDLLWLAGLLEGEGSFMRGHPDRPNLPVISLTMTDEDVIARAASVMGVNYCEYDRKPGVWKVMYVIQFKGKRACEIMELLRPHMGARRRGQIDSALGCYEDRRKPPALTSEQAAEIRSRYRKHGAAAVIGAEYGISKWMVYAIHQGRAYASA
jgi:hypothetical protein